MDLCNINDIRNILGRHGFRFSKSMGQNFLVDASVPRRIAEYSGIDGTSGVLEIGPGIGCLTEQLAANCAKVVAVELDERLIPVLGETLSQYENVSIINSDVMKLDIPSVVKEHFEDLRPSVCANLPYNITTPVLTALIEAGCFETITVMIQREVARRICAEPATPDYGAFTVFANYYTTPELLFDVSPDSFIPQPKVWSSVVKMTRRTAPSVQIDDEKIFFRVVRGSFAQRRKTLLNGLSSAFSGVLTKTQIADVIAGAGFDERVRGEGLGIAEFASIANAIAKMI